MSCVLIWKHGGGFGASSWFQKRPFRDAQKPSSSGARFGSSGDEKSGRALLNKPVQNSKMNANERFSSNGFIVAKKHRFVPPFFGETRRHAFTSEERGSGRDFFLCYNAGNAVVERKGRLCVFCYIQLFRRRNLYEWGNVQRAVLSALRHAAGEA